MEEKFNLENKKISPEIAENKLEKLKTDQKNIKTDLVKYFDIKIEELDSKREFLEKRDEQDSEELISRYKILDEKIRKWEKILENYKTKS
ncbi:MAG: hypothetical protein ABH951_03050 [Patescibacteria group bacterium]